LNLSKVWREKTAKEGSANLSRKPVKGIDANWNSLEADQSDLGNGKKTNQAHPEQTNLI
jgi:hypothetical protein